MANEVTPTILAGHIRKVWSPEIGLAANEEQVIVPNFLDLNKIEGEQVYRKYGTLAASSLANGDSGQGLTAAAVSPTSVSTTPGTKYVMTITNLNTIKRCVFNPNDPLRKLIESSLYEQVDQLGAALATGLATNVTGGAGVNWDDSLVREARRMLVTSAKSKYNVKKDKYVCVFHPYGLDDLEGIEAFYRADMRGDDENPLVSGVLYHVRGGYWSESGNIQIDTAARNMMFIPNLTFGIGFNQKYDVMMQPYELVQKLIGWVDVGVQELWDEYGVLINTKPTAS